MRLFGVVLVLMGAGCGGDSACETPTTWCDQGNLYRCVGDKPVLEQDCSALGDELGVMKSCATLKQADDQACVDSQQVGCSTGGAMECAPGRKALRVCVETDFGMIWNSQTLQPTCTEGQECHPTLPGQFVCISPPAVRCTQEARCDGMMLERCAGNTTDGYVLVEKKNCPTRCQVGVGQPICD